MRPSVPMVIIALVPTAMTFAWWRSHHGECSLARALKSPEIFQNFSATGKLLESDSDRSIVLSVEFLIWSDRSTFTSLIRTTITLGTLCTPYRKRG